MATGLSLKRLIDVTLDLSPSASQYTSVTSVMVVGDSDVIDTTERYRTYSTLDEVGGDFSSTDPEYEAATVYFDQSPTPESLVVGRWAQTATSGRLVCGIQSTTEQTITNWNSVTTGGFNVSVDGGSVTSVSGINLSAVTTLSGVASAINTQLTAASLAVTCAWDGEKFIFTSASTGVNSQVSLLTTSNSGTTDISTLLKGTTSTYLRRVTGIAAETALASIQALDNMHVSGYMVTYASENITDSDHANIAAYVEAASIPHIYGITTQNTNALSSSSTTDIGYVLHQLQYQRTTYAYSSTSKYLMMSLFGRMSTVDFTGQNTTITIMYKTAPGITAETLTTSQADALDAKQYNYYGIVNSTSIIFNGYMAADNVYLDDVQGSDWLVNRVQVDLFNLFRTTKTKIPYTDAGLHTIATKITSSLDVGVNNGLIAAGTWSYDGFGTLATDDYLEDGYYVYVPSVANQSTSSKQSRTVSSVQVAAIYAGAVHKCGITINVQR